MTISVSSFQEVVSEGLYRIFDEGYSSLGLFWNDIVVVDGPAVEPHVFVTDGIRRDDRVGQNHFPGLW